MFKLSKIQQDSVYQGIVYTYNLVFSKNPIAQFNVIQSRSKFLENKIEDQLNKDINEIVVSGISYECTVEGETLVCGRGRPEGNLIELIKDLH